MRPLIGAAALLALAAGACTASEEDDGPAAPECDAGEFTILDEELGEYEYSVSFSCPEGDANPPVVIALHGMPGSGWQMRSDSELDELAEQEGFMAVYPSDPSRQWDAAADGDDTAFLSDLIDTLIDRWSADPERVYLTGMSNGADMTLAAGTVLADKVAAIAPVVPSGTGSVYDAVDRLEEPLPMVVLVGESDAQYLEPGMRGVESWFEAGGCAGEGVAEEEDGYTLETWTCDGGVEARLYRVDGGHLWFGSPTHDYPLWASQVVWDFFSGSAG